jgi:magnesium-transporting ATPase (P-type)
LSGLCRLALDVLLDFDTLFLIAFLLSTILQ